MSAGQVGQPLGWMRRTLRWSSLARLLWLVVAALHAWLVLRRFALAEWSGTLNAVRGVVCLGGVFYGSLKFWQVATVLDSAPRRALAFALVLMLGHWILATPVQAEGPAATPLSAAAVLMVAPVLGAGLILAVRVRRPLAVRRPAASASLSFLHFDSLPLAVSRREYNLFRRPPPFPH